MFGTRRQRENERLDVHVPFETARLYREAWGEDAPFTDTLPDWRRDEHDCDNNSIDYKLRPCGHYRINDDDRPCGICNVVPLSDDDIKNSGELMRVLDDYFADFDEVIVDRIQHSDGSDGYMDKDGNWVRLSAGGIAGR